MTDITAKIICDSVSEYAIRLRTFQLRYPRFIHAELLTHRQFSRNASSSRAVPVRKNIEEVRTRKVSPIWWGREQKGMQSYEELTGDDLIEVQTIWDAQAICAANSAEQMAEHRLYKSATNRVLEPFLHINVIMTCTDDALQNFLRLRLDHAAQHEIYELARVIQEASENSSPRLRQRTQWHLPFIEPDEYDLDLSWKFTDDPIRVSAARCARVSYFSFTTGKKSTIDEDLRLYNLLVNSEPPHLSPTEHQAQPDKWYRQRHRLIWEPEYEGEWMYASEHGNLTGWRQNRKMIENKRERIT